MTTLKRQIFSFVFTVLWSDDTVQNCQAKLGEIENLQ